MNKSKSIVKRTLWVIIAIALLCLAVIVCCEIAVHSASRGRLYSDVYAIPHREVGLLLGTNPKGHNGGVNQFYDRRIDAAVDLYEADKVDRFIISGAARPDQQYDEPAAMREALLSRGVPDSILVLDREGFHTNASIERAKAVFGVDSLTIVSQKFHNERALFMAKHNGLDAIAYNAADTQNLKWKYIILFRERGSRVKAVFEAMKK